MNKWYMDNPESVQENETHKFLWDFEIQTDQQISSRSYNNQQKKKKKKKKKKRTCKIVEFVVPADYRGKLKESKK